MEFELEDIRPAFEVQVVSGLFFDRRTFLVVDTGDGRPTVIALMPHQARGVAEDLADPALAGRVHERRRAQLPVATPLIVRPGVAEGTPE